MLLIVKSYEILPKHSAQSFNSEFFLFQLIYFSNIKKVLPLTCRFNTNLFLDCVKLIEYFASPANVVLFNPYVRLRYLFPYYQHA